MGIPSGNGAPPFPVDQAPSGTHVAEKPVYEWDRTIEERQRAAAEEIIRKTPFPQPKAKTLPFPEFCEYWNALRELPVSRYARLFVRRWFPSQLPEEIEDARSGLKRESHPCEVKLTVIDGPLNEQRILDSVGVGDYTIRLNDTRRPFDQATVVHCEKLYTSRDWDHYPPIMDIGRLDWEDEGNRVYIKFAQAKGILPRETDREKEQADMATATVVDKVLQESRLERDRADRIQQQLLQKSEEEAKEAKAAAQKAQQSVPAVEPKTSAGGDLLAVVQSVATLANSLKAAPDNSLSEYLKLQAEREKTEREREKEERAAARQSAADERKRADDLQNQILAELRKEAKAVPSEPKPPQTTLQVLEEEVQKQKLLRQLGRGGAEENAEQNGHGTIDKLTELAPVIQICAPIVNNIITGLFQTVQQVSYNIALGKSSTPQPPTTMTPTETKPGAPAAPILTPEQQAQQAQLQTWIQELDSAAGPLRSAFKAGKPGDSIAELVIEFKGRPSYDLIRALGQTGPDAFDVGQFLNNVRMLLIHPGRTKAIAELADDVLDKPSFAKFLADFFNYDAILETEQKKQEGAEA